MNGYERLMSVINGEPADRTPVWPFLMMFSAKYAGIPYGEFATDYKRLVQAQAQTAIDFDVDCVAIDSDAYREASACGAVLTFPKDDLPLLERYAIEDKLSFDFKLPDISSSERMYDKVMGVEYAKAQLKGEKAVLGWIEAPFQCAGTLYPMDELMVDVYDEDSFLMELLDFTTRMAIEFAQAQAKAGADIIGMGDAMASLVSPAIYEKFVLPLNQKVVDELRRTTNAKIKYHICGDSTHLLPLIAKVGFDVVNIDYKVPLQTAHSALANTCIKGNLDPVGVLMNGTPPQIIKKAQELQSLNIPRLILSPGCEVPHKTPHENLRALVQSAAK